MRSIPVGFLCAGALAASAALAQAPAFPSKPVKLIVTTGPGIVTDLNARLLATKLAAMWNQPVVVENRVGGNAIIGTDAMVKSPPDGHTLLVTTTGIVQNPATRAKDLPYDTLRDIAPVAQLFVVRILYAIDAALPAKTIGDYLALAKANPGKYTFGSYGTGSTAHMLAAKLNLDAGVNIVHVPYNGPAPAVRALLAGDVSSVMAEAASMRAHVESGKVRLLAATGGKRSPHAPEVPTFAEAGISGFAVDSWAGLFAPAATPAPVIAKIAADVTTAIAMPDVQAWYVKATVEPPAATPAEFKDVFKQDIDYWTRLVRSTNLKVD